MLADKTTFFFDLDGLLLDTERLYFETRREVLARTGYDYTEAVHLSYAGRGWRYTLAAMQELAGSEALGQALFDEALALFNHRVEMGDLQLKPGASDLLSELRHRERQIFITSNGKRENIERFLARTELTDAIDQIISSEHVTRLKPAPDLYHYAQEQSKQSKAQILIFEDSPTGVQAALDSGMDTVIVPDIVTINRAQCERAYRVVDSLEQVLTWFDEEVL